MNIMKVKILLVEDHTVMREGLRSLLESYPDMVVVGESGNGRDAVRLARNIKPDVVLMDVSMPDLNGIDATSQLLADNDVAPPKIIALSMHSDKRFVEQMLRAGACGYLLKNCATKELVFAIREVAKGQIYLSPGITRVVVNEYLRQLPARETSTDSNLTTREREIAQLIAEGWDTRHIAENLHLSPKTIESHRRRIMEKLHIDSIAQLTKFAIREGLTLLEK